MKTHLNITSAPIISNNEKKLKLFRNRKYIMIIATFYTPVLHMHKLFSCYAKLICNISHTYWGCG